MPIFFFNYNTFKRINRCFKEENGQSPFSSHNTDKRTGNGFAQFNFAHYDKKMFNKTVIISS